MKRVTFFLVAVAAVVGLAGLIAPAPGQADGQSAAPYVTEIPHGYRDWKWVSSAHEAGNLNSLGAVLGNELAMKAYRDGKLPFPEGTIIAALHYRNVPSDENNKVFGQVQSFVPGPANKHSVYGEGLKKVRRNRVVGGSPPLWMVNLPPLRL